MPGGGIESLQTIFELLWRFEPLPTTAGQPTAARARYRVVQYLGAPGVAPTAGASKADLALERQAEGRAVSILDYDLELRRVVAPVEADAWQIVRLPLTPTAG